MHVVPLGWIDANETQGALEDELDDFLALANDVCVEP